MSYDLFAYDKKNPMNYRIPNFYLSPDQWMACTRSTRLSWKTKKYSDLLADPTILPTGESGIYVFLVKPNLRLLPGVNYIMYIGKAQRQSFRARFRQYIAEKDDPAGRVAIRKLLLLWDDHLWYMYAHIPNTADISAIEQELLSAFMPPSNVQLTAGLSKHRGLAWS